MSKDSYKSILKATSIFGGIQIYVILLTIVRGKFAAILIGPAGIGFSNLIQSSLDLVSRATSFGLGFSAITNVAKSYSSENTQEFGKTTTILRRLLLLTGILGCITTLIFSPLLSKWTFGNQNHTIDYIILAITLLFSGFTGGYGAILRGTQNTSAIAYSSLWGGISGLLISISCYYYMGLNGIIPAIGLTSFAIFLITRKYCRPYLNNHSNISWYETIKEGKGMLSLGILLSLGAIIGSIVTYATNVFIAKNGSTTEVGLLQAANSLTSQYFGLIFIAMSSDYLPRLSSCISNKTERDTIVQQQAEISTYIITPFILLIIIIAPLLVTTFLTTEFLASTILIQWIAFGTIFKAAAFSLGYISIANEDKRLFFILEGIVFNIITYTLNIAFYSNWGLLGLAISFCIIYIISLIIYIMVAKIKYNFFFKKKYIITTSALSIIIFVNLIILTQTSLSLKYYISIFSFIFTTALCCYEINQQSDVFKSVFNKLKTRKK